MFQFDGTQGDVWKGGSIIGFSYNPRRGRWVFQGRDGVKLVGRTKSALRHAVRERYTT